MIRLPNAATAVVPPEKVRDYLLLPDHAQNQGKAEKFVRSVWVIDWGKTSPRLVSAY